MNLLSKRTRTVILFLKSRVKGYTRKDGVYVKPHFRLGDAKPKGPKSSVSSGSAPAPGQLSLFSGSEPTHTAPVKDMIAEHERLVDVLESPSHEDDKAEAKKQKKELKEYKEEGDKPKRASSADLDHLFGKDKRVLLTKPKKASEKPVADQTKTEKFLSWFGDSKVTDDDGKPLVVYHGTNKDIKKFKTDRPAWFSVSTELANKFVGGGRQSMGQGSKKGSSVYPVYLSLQKPLNLTEFAIDGGVSIKKVLEKAGLDSSDSALRKLAQRNLDSGYAGVSDSFDDKAGYLVETYTSNLRLADALDDRGLIETLKEAGFDGLSMREDGSDTYAVFNGNQVKSAIGNSGAFDPKNADLTKSVSSEQDYGF